MALSRCPPFQDFGFPDFSSICEDNWDALTLSRKAFRYRPVELAKDNLVRLKFEFVPVKFKPLDNVLIPPKPEFLDPIVIRGAQMKILVNGKNEGFNIHFSRDGEKWYGPRYSGSYGVRGINDSGFFPSGMLPCEPLFVRIATEDDGPINSFSLDFEAILETPGFRGKGETLIVRGIRHTGEQQKDVACPLAFLDGNGDLQMIIDNSGNEPAHASLGHGSYSSWNRFIAGGASVSYSRFGSFGPPVPPQSLEVCTLRISKEKDRPGKHHYVFSVGPLHFSLNFLIPDTNDSAPNPPPGTFRMQTQGNEQPRSKEYKPEDGRPFVTFDDDIPAPSR